MASGTTPTHGAENSVSETEGYTKEIGQMMHGFGDAANPLPATVALVESVVLSQLRRILARAAENADRRGEARSQPVRPEDVVFLMRRNAPKLRRLARHLRLAADFKAKTRLLEEAPTSDDDGLKSLRRAHREALRLLRSLGDGAAADEDDDEDEVLGDRRLRADGISSRLSAEKYEAYSRARRVSFRQGPKRRFVAWLGAPEERPAADQTVELMRHLAFETVAQIVDLALIVRRDARGVASEPFAKLEGDYCNPATFEDSPHDTARGADPITVAHVREAVRRFFTPRICTEGLFSRNVKSDMPARFLAL